MSIRPERRGLHAGRPDLRASLDAAGLTLAAGHVEAGFVDADDPGAESQLDAEALQIALGAAAQPLGVAGEHGVEPVEQHDPRLRGVKAAEVVAQRAS